MKPRLNAPLTQEDFAIWDRISEPYGIKPGIPLWGYIESDRRDADLMFWAQSRPGHSGCVRLRMGGHIWDNPLVRGKKPGFEWAVPDIT